MVHCFFARLGGGSGFQSNFAQKLDYSRYSSVCIYFQKKYVLGFFLPNQAFFLRINCEVLLYSAMQYESAVINGLIEDFSTVVLFAVDILILKVAFSIWSILGCVIVGFVVLKITFEKAKKQ